MIHAVLKDLIIAGLTAVEFARKYHKKPSALGGIIIYLRDGYGYDIRLFRGTQRYHAGTYKVVGRVTDRAGYIDFVAQNIKDIV